MRFRRILSTILVYTLIVCGVSFISTLEANADSNRYNRTIDLSNEYLEEELVGAWIWDRDSDSDHIRPPIIYYLYADGSYEQLFWTPDDYDEDAYSNAPYLSDESDEPEGSWHTWCLDGDTIEFEDYYDYEP